MTYPTNPHTVRMTKLVVFFWSVIVKGFYCIRQVSEHINVNEKAAKSGRI